MNQSTRRRLVVGALAVFGTVGCFEMVSSVVAGQLLWNWHAPFLALALGLWVQPRISRWIAMIYLAFLFSWVAVFALVFGASVLGTTTGALEITKMILYGALIGLVFSEVQEWDARPTDRGKAAEPGATDTPGDAQ